MQRLKFFTKHKEKIENLLINKVEKISYTNPFAHIMDIKKVNKQKTITTTTEHLAQHFGRILRNAYGGNVRYDFSHENKLARVYWKCAE